MVTYPYVEEIEGNRKECLFKMPNWLRTRVHHIMLDKRDLIMIDLMFNITTTTIPAAILLMVTSPSHLMGFIYMASNYVLWAQRFILMLHYSQHRELFQPSYSWLNYLNPYFYCAFFGIPPGQYPLHHVVMHHVENNMKHWDLSSTMPYQRDSVLGLLHYWLRFFLGAWIELPYYAMRRRRWELALQSILAEISYIAILYIGFQFNSVATLWIFLIPFALSSFMLMFGNWSQHIFIDPNRPQDNFAITYNCINCPDNSLTFNDGFHIVHHIHSKLHWSEMPQAFIDRWCDYIKHDAFVFDGIGFFDVGFLVFTGQLKKLAKYLVPLGDKKRTTEEIIEEFKRRLKPC